MLAQLFLAGADLGQARADDSHTDQPVPGKVHALSEHTAKNGKPDLCFLRMGIEMPKKFGALGFIHAALLTDCGDRGVPGRKVLQNRLQITVAGKEGKIVAGPGICHAGDQIGNLCDAGRTVPVAGADMPGTPQPQITGRERTAQGHGTRIGQPAQILVVPCRRQRGAEQNGGATFGEVVGQKGAGIQTEHGRPDFAAVGRNLQHKVVIECVRNAKPAAHIKVELQQRSKLQR